MKAILKGVVFSFAATLALILLLSLVLYFTAFDAQIAAMGVYAGVAVSVTLGAAIAAKKCEKSVLAHAMAVSVLYLAALVIMSAALNRDLRFNAHFLAMTAGIFAAGFLGAVIGK